ncbi:MAG: transposase [Patescibacteria group bacterium]|nr:transposase [Patescibacteria group bacterium]
MQQDIFSYLRDNLNNFGFKDGRIHYKRFLEFIDATIRETKNSMNKYATVSILETSVQSALRWLKRHFKSLKKLKSWLLGLAQNNRDKRSNTYIILDDSIIKRTSKKGFGVSNLKDHTNNQYVDGNCIVSLLISNLNLLLAFDQKLYVSKKCVNGVSEKEFRSKIKIACELIESVKLDKTRAYVVIDAWYTCKKILTSIRKMGLFCVLAFKKNKKIGLFGKEYQLKELFDEGKVRYFTLDGEKYYYSAKTLYVTGWGRYKVLMMRRENDKDFRFFLTNKLNMKPINMLRHYKNRWNIEQYYRDQKQHLGLKSFFLRERVSTESYFNFVFWLFNVLSLYRYAMTKEGTVLPIETIVDEYKREFNKRTRDLRSISI